MADTEAGKGTVLVTGGSGYIGGFCVIGLLQQGAAPGKRGFTLQRPHPCKGSHPQGVGSVPAQFGGSIGAPSFLERW